MAKSNNQKGKILYLERILQGTGEDRAVSMQELLDMLAGKGVTAERKSIYDDLAVLRDFGMDIRYRRGKPGGYYLAGQQAPGETGPEGAQKADAAGMLQNLKEASIPAETKIPAQAGSMQNAENQAESLKLPETEDVRPEPKNIQTESKDVRPEPKDIQTEPKDAQPEPKNMRPEVMRAERKIPSWLEASEEARQIKLLCENSVRQEVEACIGKNGLYKDKGATSFTVAAEISETPEFYGWLTAMGGGVHILKPRKTALAYRDYLKELAREYKGL